MWRLFGSAALIVAVAIVPGCAEPAVIAAAGVTAGFGLAQGQAEAFIRGELQAARMVPMDEAWDASLAALHELQLDIKTTRRGKYDAYVRGKAEGGPEFKIKLNAKSPLVTKFSIRIGVMGDQSVSRLLMSRIDTALGIPHPVVPPEESPIVAPRPENKSANSNAIWLTTPPRHADLVSDPRGSVQ